MAGGSWCNSNTNALLFLLVKKCCFVVFCCFWWFLGLVGFCLSQNVKTKSP